MKASKNISKTRIILSLAVLVTVILITIAGRIIIVTNTKIVKANNKSEIIVGFEIDKVLENIDMTKIIFTDTITEANRVDGDNEADVVDRDSKSTTSGNNDITQEKYEYTYNDLGINTYLDDEQRADLASGMIVDVDTLYLKYNTDGLRDALNNLNKDRHRTKYAKLKIKNNKIELRSKEEGNYIDTYSLADTIINSLGTGDLEIDLSEYYEKDDETQPTESELQSEIDKVNNTYISYTNGYELKLSDLIKYLKIKRNKVVFDNTKADDLSNYIDKTIEKELLEYDTVGNEIDFKTHSGKTIKVSGGTYGNIFSSDDETVYIIDKFKKFENEVNRTPIYSQEMVNELGDTYLEVDIANQMMYHYKKGKLCCSSPIVTGDAHLHRDTPKGVYYLLERVNGKYLTGENYRTWVNKWMRVTWSGIGFHDATWRSNFGGSIYKTNGSHGCINLPKSYAYKLYDEVSVNDCVVIY